MIPALQIAGIFSTLLVGGLALTLLWEDLFGVEKLTRLELVVTTFALLHSTGLYALVMSTL